MLIIEIENGTVMDIQKNKQKLDVNHRMIEIEKGKQIYRSWQTNIQIDRHI